MSEPEATELVKACRDWHQNRSIEIRIYAPPVVTNQIALPDVRWIERTDKEGVYLVLQTHTTKHGWVDVPLYRPWEQKKDK